MPVEVEAAIAAIDAIIARLAPATRDAVAEGSKLVQAAARAKAPTGHINPMAPPNYLQHRGGALKRSIRIAGPRRAGRGAYAANIGPTVVYGRQRELGGHLYPKRVRWLRWYSRQGKPIFAKHVYQSPGPYLKPAVEATRFQFRDIVARRWAEAITRKP